MLPISAFPKRFAAALPSAITWRRSALGSKTRTWRAHALLNAVRLQSSTQFSEQRTFVKPSGTAQSQGDFSSLAAAHLKVTHVHQPEPQHHQPSPSPKKASQQQKQHQQQIRGVAPLQNLNLYGPRSKEWWTGKSPAQTPGFSAETNSLYSLPQLSLSKDGCTRQSLQAYFDNTWTLTEVLLGCLQGEEAFMKSPYHELRHPLIFYYGHPAALYVNKLRVAGLLSAPINSYYESIFETGVDEMSWDDLSKNKMPWPSVAEVHRYRKEVYNQVSGVIAGLTDEQCASVSLKSTLWALAMAFEHERIHLETSSVLISEMPISELLAFPKHLPPYHPSIPAKESSTQLPVSGSHYPANEFISVGAQKVTVGKPRDFPSFGWDNEYGERSYEVPAFRATKYKISNGEYLEFVKDGGYAKSELWSEDGWAWRSFRNVKWPSFWVRSGPQGLNHFDLRLIFDVVPMPWNWPVAVNFHEAHAYSQWVAARTGKPVRVLTELEHKAIRDDLGKDAHGQLRDPILHHHQTPEAGAANMNLACSSMSPVDANASNAKGFHDVFGNAWEWTSDYFCALPGFEVHPYYEDFSTPCFDGLHHVIQGGSFISTGNECSIFSRFHFRPHFFQHASFRLAEQSSERLVTSDMDAPGPFVGSYPFRRSAAGMKAAMKSNSNGGYSVDGEVLKHFGSVQQLGAFLGNANSGATAGAIPSRRNISELILNGARKISTRLSSARALDIGCGAGGLSFDLAAHVKAVIGVDHHLENVEIARALANKTRLHYTVPAEGALSTDVAITNVASAAQVEFRMSDPMCLPAEMMGFDIVVVNDVIDKVSSPNSVLGRLGGVRGLVASNGLLAIISCFQWNADTTPKSLWLGGYVDANTGKEVSSVATLADRLQSDFVLVSSQDQPVFWQESSSDYKCKVYSVTLFARK